MPSPNTTPIWGLTPVSTVGQFATGANTAKDGSGTVQTVYTAGSNGGYCSHINVRAYATNGASVMRIFINNGSTNATATNNTLYDELSLSATTTVETAALAAFRYVFPDGFAIPSGYKINVCFGTAGSWAPTCIARDY